MIKKTKQFNEPFPKAILSDSRWYMATWRYRAAIIEVESPRVVWCYVDYGMREYDYRHITVLGYRTPDISEGTPEERELAGKGKRFLEELLINQQVAVLTEHPDYGSKHPFRWCARVLHEGNWGNCQDLSETMIRNGYGRVIPVEESA